MTLEEITKDMDPETKESSLHLLEKWLARGDGIALYQNQAFDSSDFGRKKWVSFGSPEAQLEVPEPPQRLPDLRELNWAYQLVGTCRTENPAVTATSISPSKEAATPRNNR